MYKKMKGHMLAAIVAGVFVGVVSCHAQTAALASAGFDEQAKKIDAYISQLDKSGQPGCAVGAIKDGKLVYKRAFGLANLDYDVPNSTTTLFNLASNSKQFTAMSIMLLAQQGKLSLDDDIRKYLPEMPDYGDKITIRHLLTHTSGIRDYQALIYFGGLNTDNALDDKMILEMLTRQKHTSFKPGDKYQYSNSGFHLLGIIVGRVSGKSLREFADENIFKPLGMKSTRFFDNRTDIVKNRAAGYIVQGGKMRMRSSLFDLVGGGGVLTTVEDLYLWDRNFYEPKVGSKEIIKAMTTPAVLNDGTKLTYGFGLMPMSYRGLPIIQHGGNMAGFRAQMVRFPEQRFTSIAMCNNSAMSPTAITQKLADTYLEGQFPAAESKAADTLSKAVPIPESEFRRYSGVFAKPDDKSFIRLAPKDGKLVASGAIGRDIPVMKISDDRLLAVDGEDRTEMQPIVDKTGVTVALKLLKRGGTFDTFLQVPSPAAQEKLAEYAGIYHSDELDADYEVSVTGTAITMQIGDNDSLRVPLNAAYSDSFFTMGGPVIISFTRDEKGKIIGFVFNSSADDRDVKGVEFRKQ